MNEPRIAHDGVVGPVDATAGAALRRARHLRPAAPHRGGRPASTSRWSASRSTPASPTGRAPASGRRTSARRRRLLRPYNPALDVQPFGVTQVADAGDIAVNPFDIERGDRDDRGRASVTLAAPRTDDSSPSAATTRSRCPSLRVLREVHGPSRWCTSTRTSTRGTPTSVRRYTHGTPFRRAWEEQPAADRPGDARRHPRPAVRHEGSRGRPSFGFSIVHCHDIETDGVDRRRRTHARARRRRRRSTSRSTSTCSTPPTLPAPAHPRRAA